MLPLCSESSRSYTLKGVRYRVRGDLSGLRSHLTEAPYVATCRVTGQKSAEVIVGEGRRHEVV